MRSFLGIFLATGLVCLPNLENYWEVNFILNAYGTPGYDKLYKIRPIIDAICKKVRYNLVRNISVDGAMVKFKDR